MFENKVTEYILNKVLNYYRFGVRSFDLISIFIFLLTLIFLGIVTFYVQNYVSGWILLIWNRQYNIIPIFNREIIVLFFSLWLLPKELMIVDWIIDRFFIWRSNKKVNICSIDFGKLSQKDFGKNWIVQGSPNINDKGLLFTNSSAGCLIKARPWWKLWKPIYRWKDFEARITIDFTKLYSFDTMEFQNKVSKKNKDLSINRVWKQVESEYRQILGIVFRAQSLEDYFMTEVWKLGKKIVIRPHVRISSNWDAPYYNSPSILNVKSNKEVVEIKIIVISNNLSISTEGKEVKFTLPNTHKANLIENPMHQEKDKGLNGGSINNNQLINKSGMFGFRNYGNEAAIVKELKIEPLKKQKNN